MVTIQLIDLQINISNVLTASLGIIPPYGIISKEIHFFLLETSVRYLMSWCFQIPSRLRHRAKIVVAAEEYPPHAFVLLLGGTDGRGQPRFTITGPMVKLLEILATSMNFT